MLHIRQIWELNLSDRRGTWARSWCRRLQEIKGESVWLSSRQKQRSGMQERKHEEDEVEVCVTAGTSKPEWQINKKRQKEVADSTSGTVEAVFHGNTQACPQAFRQIQEWIQSTQFWDQSFKGEGYEHDASTKLCIHEIKWISQFPTYLVNIIDRMFLHLFAGGSTLTGGGVGSAVVAAVVCSRAERNQSLHMKKIKPSMIIT